MPKLSRPGFFSSLFFALLPASGVGGGLALAPLIGAAGLGGLKPGRAIQTVRRAGLFLALFAAFAGWAILSAAWSVYPNHSQALRTAATLIGGLLFCIAATDPSARPLTRASGIAAAIVMAAFLIAEALWDMPFNRLAQPYVTDLVLLSRNPGRGATILGVICWPALGALLGPKDAVSRVLAALVFIACAWVSLQFDMQANAIGFVCGLAAFSAAIALPRIAMIATSWSAALYLLTAPLVTPALLDLAERWGRLPDSWAMRDSIWRFACAHIKEHPLIGMGLDASRGFHQMVVIRGNLMRVIPLHPHNGSLQIWLETGVIGTLLAGAALIVGGVALTRIIKTRAAAGAASGAIAAFAVSFNVSYGVWQEWWWATAFAAAAMIGAIAADDASPEAP